MKYLVLTPIFLFLSSLAQAATSASSALPTPAPTPTASAAPSAAVAPLASPTPSSTQEDQGEDHKLRFAIGVYGSTKGAMLFNDVEYISGSSATNGKLEYDASSSMGIIAEAIYARRNKPGFSAGIDYETPRKITNPNATTNGTAYTPTQANDTTIQFTSLYGNFIYRFDIFFVYLGVNLSGSKIKNAPPFLNDAKGNFGGQLGAGWFFSDHLSLDLGMHAKGVYSDTISDAGISIRPRTGSVGAFSLTAKYIF